MKLEKELLIDSFMIQGVSNAPYVIKAISEGYESSLTFGDGARRKFGIRSSLNITGRNLIVTLNSKEMPREDRVIISAGKEDLLISRIGFNEETTWHYMTFPDPSTHESGSYFARLISPGGGDGIHLSASPCPYFDLKVPLSPKEYFGIKNLPKRSIFGIDLKLE